MRFNPENWQKNPTSANKKPHLQSWLSSKNISIVTDLLNIVKQYNKYIVGDMTREQNQIVLRLLPKIQLLNLWIKNILRTIPQESRQKYITFLM